MRISATNGDNRLMLEMPLTGYVLFLFCFPSTRTWMLWPVRRDIWRENAAPARAAYAAIALSIADFEPVFVGVPIDHYATARAVLGDHPNITVFEISQDDSWARDTFPTFLRNRQTSNVRGVDWIFNGYGGLYSPHKDSLLAAKVRVYLCAHLHILEDLTLYVFFATPYITTCIG